MPGPTHNIDETYPLSCGLTLRLQTASEDDMDEIKRLYYVTYGGNYTLPEVVNTDKMKWAVNDPNYLWLLCRVDEKIAGSVIFLTDERHRLGKALAGVVLPDFRGYKIMKTAMERGIRYVFQEKDRCDLIYGVVRTFVTKTFHEDLAELGFIDLGIFPNVRKLSKYETHGLKVLFREGALKKRKTPPRLIQPSNAIYEIVQKRLGLDPAEPVEYKYETPSELEKFEFYIEKSPDIEWEYYKKRDQGKLIMSVFPFHYPEIKLYTRDKRTQAYIHFEERDGHGDLMGLETDQPEKLTHILESIAGYAESMGIKYLEILLDAYNPEQQMRAYEADFLPCAYFPAITAGPDGKRLDFVVTCRTFVPLDFKDIKLTDGSRPYVRAYYKLRTTKLWEDLEHA